MNAFVYLLLAYASQAHLIRETLCYLKTDFSLEPMKNAGRMGFELYEKIEQRKTDKNRELFHTGIQIGTCATSGAEGVLGYYFSGIDEEIRRK